MDWRGTTTTNKDSARVDFTLSAKYFFVRFPLWTNKRIDFNVDTQFYSTGRYVESTQSVDLTCEHGIVLAHSQISFVSCRTFSDANQNAIVRCHENCCSC